MKNREFLFHRVLRAKFHPEPGKQSFLYKYQRMLFNGSWLTVDNTAPPAAIPLPGVVEVIAVWSEAAVQDDSFSRGVIAHRRRAALGWVNLQSELGPDAVGKHPRLLGEG